MIGGVTRLAAMVAASALATLAGCRGRDATIAPPPPPPPVAAADEAAMTAARDAMVRTQLVARDIRAPTVLAAMRTVPRHRFVPGGAPPPAVAYGDHPVAIGMEQTMSQPFIVAYMTAVLDVRAGERVLEIGTGSGYQAAVLAELGAEVYTIEIVEPLAQHATTTLAALGYRNVHVRAGDGYRGWPEEAPFDAVIVTAAPERVPAPLLEQLRVGGRLIAPVGDREQTLVVLTRTPEGMRTRHLLPVRFVPMTGAAEAR